MLNVLIIIRQCLSGLMIESCYKNILKYDSNLMDIKLDSEPIYGDNDKYIKTKM